jgi:hypothetical protein
LSGSLLNTASIKGLYQLRSLGLHRYLQHSKNFISAASPPFAAAGSIPSMESPKASLQLFVYIIPVEH